jgi:hypothetical protein
MAWDGQLQMFEHFSCMQVFMLDATTRREVPYMGTIAADKLGGEAPANPFMCSDLQGRYQVRHPFFPNVVKRPQDLGGS